MSHKSKGTHVYGWQYTGQQRPDFADEPKPGEESVWDYPRPPAIVDDHRVVRVVAFDGTVLVESGLLRLERLHVHRLFSEVAKKKIEFISRAAWPLKSSGSLSIVQLRF